MRTCKRVQSVRQAVLTYRPTCRPIYIFYSDLVISTLSVSVIELLISAIKLLISLIHLVISAIHLVISPIQLMTSAIHLVISSIQIIGYISLIHLVIIIS